jgi:hypothetical protein
MRRLTKLLLSCLLCVEFSEYICAQHGLFSDKIVFFGSRKSEETSPVVRTFALESGGISEVVSFTDEIPMQGRVSPDGKLLAVSLVKRENGDLTKHPRLEVIDQEGNRRNIAEDAEVIAWSPDSQKILCRRGKNYGWSHCLVDLQNGQETALPIEPKDAVMDWSPNGNALGVMKGRPDSLWKRGPDDFYPKRQLYFAALTSGQPKAPFTDAEEDCIWWRYSSAGKQGVYYRRHYATGRPVETAMIADADGRNPNQLIDFTALGVRPGGSPCWSPDETQLLWQVTREPSEERIEYELMFVPLGEKKPRFVTADSLGLESFGRIDWR